MKFSEIKENILSKYSVRQRKKFWFVAILLFYPIAQFLLFYVYVNFSSFFIAFQDNYGAWTTENFQRVFDGFFGEVGGLRKELFRSFITWCVGMFVSFPMSVLMSYALWKKIPGNKAFRVILYFPTMLGGVVCTRLFKYLCAYNGPILTVVKWLGFTLPEALAQAGLFGYVGTAFPTILFYSIWIGIGGNLIVLTGALVRIPNEVLEAGKLDGVGFFREFWQIAIPLIYPTLNTLMIFSMAGIFTADAGTFLFTRNGGYETSTIGFRLFIEVYYISNAGVGAGNTAYGYPAALGMILSVITIPLVLVWRHFLEKHLEAVGY